MYTPEQVEEMIFQHCNERLQMSESMFYNYKAWAGDSLYSLSGMDSIDVIEFNMFTEQAFGVTLSEDELYHLSLESIIKKCVSLQKPKPTPTPQAEQAKPKPVATEPQAEQAKPQPVATEPQAEQAKPQAEQAKPQVEQAKPQAEQAKPQPVATEPQAEQAKPKVKQAKPKTTTKPKVGQAKPKPAPKPQAEQTKPQPVATKPAEQPQVETKTMAGMMVCKLLGDVCNRRPTGKPNYDAQNWCEFVDCVLFTNFQKLR